MKNQKHKVLITATVMSHIAQFHKPLAQMLHKHGYEVHIAAKDNLAVKNGLKIEWADKAFDVPFSRSPKSGDNIKAYKELKKIIDSESYEFIHCNTPMGGIVTRLAARDARKHGTKVFYTAHGFHFYKGASKIAWAVYYPIEKFFCRWTDNLITINREDSKLANRKFNVQASYIHGVGVDAERYTPLTDSNEEIQLRHEFDIPKDAQVILSVGELLPNKNQKMIIMAMKQILADCPNALLIMAGNGPEKENLEALINENNLSEHVRMIGYCTFLEKYQKVASLLAACSHREGLPLNLVEAMLAKNPVVAGANRGHCELVEDGATGYIVSKDDYSNMAKRIINLLTNESLRSKMGEQARNFALLYSYSQVKQELENIYFPTK
jgi:glycosyltransferase EpsD